jgi:hypothetical protein
VFLPGGVFLVGAASSYRHLEARGQERRFSPLVHAGGGGALGTRGAIKNKSDLPTCYFFGSSGFIKRNICMCFRAPHAEKRPERRFKNKFLSPQKHQKMK